MSDSLTTLGVRALLSALLPFPADAQAKTNSSSRTFGFLCFPKLMKVCVTASFIVAFKPHLPR
jgi:hypothetical protein